MEGKQMVGVGAQHAPDLTGQVARFPGGRSATASGKSATLRRKPIAAARIPATAPASATTIATPTDKLTP